MPELRTLPDPEKPEYWWRMNGFVLEFRYDGLSGVGDWHPFSPHWGIVISDRIPERVAVWRELFLHPT